MIFDQELTYERLTAGYLLDKLGEFVRFAAKELV